jgi:hypothetical protein
VVDSFAKTGVYRPSPGDALSLLGEIVSRIDGIRPELSERDAEVASEIRAYAVFLSLLYSTFLAAGRA